MTTRLVARAVSILFGATLGLAGFVGPAAATAPVVCGSTLTADTVLSANLHCPGAGLTLAPGVDLDLGGYRLTGDGTGTAITATDATSNVIRNGTIRGWELGLSYAGGEDLRYGQLTLSGVTLVAAALNMTVANVEIENSVFRASPLTFNVTEVHAHHSTFRNSSTLGEMNAVTVEDSLVVGGGLGIDENNQVTIVRTTMDGTGYNFVPMFCQSVISGSTVKNYSVGIYGFSGCPVTVTGSTFRNNDVPLGGGSLTVTSSTFVGNTTAIQLDETTESSITSSTFRNNSGSGIYTDQPGLPLGDNVAVGNGEYGIYAPGAIDLGGNVAKRNGIADCVGLVCSRS